MKNRSVAAGFAQCMKVYVATIATLLARFCLTKKQTRFCGIKVKFATLRARLRPRFAFDFSTDSMQDVYVLKMFNRGKYFDNVWPEKKTFRLS